MEKEEIEFIVLKRTFMKSFFKAKYSALIMGEFLRKSEYDPIQARFKLKYTLNAFIQFFLSGERLFKKFNEPGWKKFNDRGIKTARLLVILINTEHLDKDKLLYIWAELDKYITEMLLPLNFESMFKNWNLKTRSFSVN